MRSNDEVTEKLKSLKTKIENLDNMLIDNDVSNGQLYNYKQVENIKFDKAYFQSQCLMLNWFLQGIEEKFSGLKDINENKIHLGNTLYYKKSNTYGKVIMKKGAFMTDARGYDYELIDPPEDFEIIFKPIDEHKMDMKQQRNLSRL